MSAASVRGVRAAQRATKKIVSERGQIGYSVANIVVDKPAIETQSGLSKEDRFYHDVISPPVLPSADSGAYMSSDELAKAKSENPFLNADAHDTAFQFLGSGARIWLGANPDTVDRMPTGDDIESAIASMYSDGLRTGATSTDSHLPIQTTVATLPSPVEVKGTAETPGLGAGWRDDPLKSEIAARIVMRSTRVIGIVDRVDSNESANGRSVAQVTGMITHVNMFKHVPLGTRHYPTVPTKSDIEKSPDPEFRQRPTLVWKPYSPWDYDLLNIQTLRGAANRILKLLPHEVVVPPRDAPDMVGAGAKKSYRTAVGALYDKDFVQQIDRTLYQILRGLMEFSSSAIVPIQEMNGLIIERLLALLADIDTATLALQPVTRGLLRILLANRELLQLFDQQMVIINEMSMEENDEGTYRIVR